MDEVTRLLAGPNTYVESFCLIDAENHGIEVGQKISFTAYGETHTYTITGIEPASGPGRIRVRCKVVPE